MTHSGRFVHHRLDAYHGAFELFVGVEELAAQLERGHADLKNQVRRSAAATVRHIAEGANRIHPRDKAARFVLARAECGECEVALEMAQIAGHSVGGVRHLADRVAAMLTGLVHAQHVREP